MGDFPRRRYGFAGSRSRPKELRAPARQNEVGSGAALGAEPGGCGGDDGIVGGLDEGPVEREGFVGRDGGVVGLAGAVGAEGGGETDQGAIAQVLAPVGRGESRGWLAKGAGLGPAAEGEQDELARAGGEGAGQDGDRWVGAPQRIGIRRAADGAGVLAAEGGAVAVAKWDGLAAGSGEAAGRTVAQHGADAGEHGP